MGFDAAEIAAMNEFQAQMPDRPEWPEDSELAFLAPAATATKGRFARSLVERFADELGLGFEQIIGNRCRIGDALLQVKFSMENPARFQQVPFPQDRYDYLLCIAARPDLMVYWLIPGPDVERLIDEDAIAYQHAEESRWFRPELVREDAFSRFRSDRAGLLEKLLSLG